MRGTVIVVTDRRLIPPKAGYATRIIHLLRGLRAVGYRVVLIAPRVSGRLSPLLPAVVSTLRTRRLVDHLVSVDAAPFLAGSLEYDCSPFLPALARAVRRFDPVAVIAQYCWMAPCLDVVTNGALKAVDTHDVMHGRVALYGAVDRGAWIACTREEEAAKLGHADVIMAIQRHERREFEAMLPDKHVVCVPHICWPEPGSRRPAESPGGVVTFVGSWNDGNQLGVEAFIRDAWPEVRRRHPTAELRIYGGVVSRLDPGSARDGVRLVGRTKHLAAAYDATAVVINPVQLGTGLKIKTVEALSFGKAVVTTSCGAAGIEDAAGRAYLLEDDMPRFGRAVAGLLADRAARASLEEGARAFVQAHFGPHAALRELVDAIESWKAREAREAREARASIPLPGAPPPLAAAAERGHRG